MKESRYAIGINKEGGIWFYVGTKDHEGVGLIPVHRYSSIVDDAVVYDSYEEAERIANSEIPRRMRAMGNGRIRLSKMWTKICRISGFVAKR